METPKAFNLVLVSLIATACFAACAVKKSDRLKGAASGLKTADKISAVCQGGQPGLVQIQGAVITGDAADAHLDDRLKTSAHTGASLDAKVVALDKANTAQVTGTTDASMLADLDSNRNYINLGCPDLTRTTEGMTQITVDAKSDVTIYKANRIFVCGKQNLASSRIVMQADQILMQDAVLTVADSSAGVLELHANTLVLQGTNVVSTKGKSSATAANPAPASGVLLAVVKEINTTGKNPGTLEVNSDGGDCVKADGTAEAKAVTPAQTTATAPASSANDTILDKMPTEL